jgi:hypothetical protein
MKPKPLQPQSWLLFAISTAHLCHKRAAQVTAHQIAITKVISKGKSTVITEATLLDTPVNVKEPQGNNYVSVYL